jgi:hypothetical protein
LGPRDRNADRLGPSGHCAGPDRLRQIIEGRHPLSFRY